MSDELTDPRIISGNLTALDSAGREVLQFFTRSGELRVGASENGGDITVCGPLGAFLHIVSATGAGPGRSAGTLTIRDSEGNQGVVLSGASVTIGDSGNDGVLTIMDSEGRLVARIFGENATMYLGAPDRNGGGVVVRDDEGREVIKLDGQYAALHLGAAGNEGDVVVHNDAGRPVIGLSGGGRAHLTVGYQPAEGEPAVTHDRGNDGTVHVRDLMGRDVITLIGGPAWLNVGYQPAEGEPDLTGDEGNAGRVRVRDLMGRDVIELDGQRATLYLGADVEVQDEGNAGDVVVRDGRGREVIALEGAPARLTVGANGHAGSIFVRDSSDNERICLDGATGDIRLRGADCAEEFDVVDGETVDPGTVLVINDEGSLRPCARAYDRCVAGVVSGASGLTPGIVLDKDPARNGRLPIALNGKVYCKVDAQTAPIGVGDLLTTSEVSGHAMKAQDAGQAFGAVIGKALRSQATGRGLIPILVSLQ